MCEDPLHINGLQMLGTSQSKTKEALVDISGSLRRTLKRRATYEENGR